MLCVVPGARTIANTEALAGQARCRTGAQVLNLMTSDDYPAYETAILRAYGETFTPALTGRPARPPAPRQVAAAGPSYAVMT